MTAGGGRRGAKVAVALLFGLPLLDGAEDGWRHQFATTRRGGGGISGGTLTILRKDSYNSYSSDS